jgi:hypothetical protein
MTHYCPVDGCQVRIRRSHLMCWTHWFQVPARLRALVARTWQHGAGQNSAEHVSAKQEAIAFVNGTAEARRLRIKRCAQAAERGAKV